MWHEPESADIRCSVGGLNAFMGWLAGLAAMNSEVWQ